MSNFTLYVIGFVIVIAGLAYGAFLLGVPPVWIGVGIVVLLGMAIIKGVSNTRSPEPPRGEREHGDTRRHDGRERGGTRRYAVDD